MRPTVRAVLYLPVLGLAYLITGVAVVVAAALVSPDLAQQGFDLGVPIGLLLSGSTFLAVLSVTFAFRRWIDHAPLAGLGLGNPRTGMVELLGGFLLGVALMMLILAVQAMAGGYRFGPGPLVQPGQALSYLVLALISFWFVAAGEEIVARGYLLQNIEQDWGVAVALAISSALFGVAHLGNPHSGLTATVGVGVAGLLLGATYLATRSLWAPIGLHWSWNFMQGPLFGFPVSGLEGQSLLSAREQGPDWLTGGAFGPEASVVAMVLELAVATALLGYAARKGRLKANRLAGKA